MLLIIVTSTILLVFYLKVSLWSFVFWIFLSKIDEGAILTMNMHTIGKKRTSGCFAVIYENSPNGHSKCKFRTIPGKLIKELCRLFKFNPFVSLSKSLLPQISKNFFLVVVIYCRKDPWRQLREGLKISRNVTKPKLALFVTRFKIQKYEP